MEEKEIELEYRVERSTEYGDYISIVKVDNRTRKQTIELYDGEPFETIFLIIPIEREPISVKTVGPFTDIEKTITQMIVEYELPYYQKERSQSNDQYLEIDYEEELERRKPKPKEDQLNEVSVQNPIPVNDYQDGRYVLTNNGKMVNEKSYFNLKQFKK